MGQSEVGGQFAHRSLIFITFYLRKIKFKKKIKVQHCVAKNATFFRTLICSWHWFYVVEKSYTKIKKIIAKNLTCTVSVKVRLSTVEFKNKKTLKFTVLYRKQSKYQLYVNITIETIANTN